MLNGRPIFKMTEEQFCINCAAQYSGLTLTEVGTHVGNIGPSILLAPVQGLGTSYQYVRAA